MKKLLNAVDQLGIAIRNAVKGTRTADEAKIRIKNTVEKVNHLTVRELDRFHLDVHVQAGDDPDFHHFICNCG